MKTWKIGYSALVLVAALLLVGRPAIAAITNLRFPIDDSVFNDCTGETIDFTGVIHFLVHSTVNGNTAHLVDQTTVRAMGIETNSGAEYNVNAFFTTEMNAAVGEETTSITHIRLVGKGRAENLNAFFWSHITVDANGDVKVERDKIRIVCTP
jgi:hypothetical protein